MRNFVFSDEGELINKLAREFNLVIFTNSKMSNSLSTYFEGLSHEKIQVEIFEKKVPARIEQIALSLLRLHNVSEANLKNIWLKNGQEDRNAISVITRLIIRKLIMGNSCLPKLFRVLLKRAVLHKYKESQIQAFHKLSVDCLFATSITNFPEDASLSIIFQSLGVPILGTARSWDNLSSHGTLPLAPDLFFAHSNLMKEHCFKYQNLPQEKIFLGLTPNYQAKFLEKDGIQREPRFRKSRILYACMGLAVNPNETEFLEWLFHISREMYEEFHLCVLEHPAFPNAGLEELAKRGLETYSFDYMSSNLKGYYSYLSSFDLIIGGGTSVLLDCFVMGLNCAFLEFEISDTSYWKSTLRYTDHFPHMIDFLEKSNVQRVKTKESLINLLKGASSKFDTFYTPEENVSFFVGRNNIPAAHLVKDAVASLLK